MRGRERERGSDPMNMNMNINMMIVNEVHISWILNIWLEFLIEKLGMSKMARLVKWMGCDAFANPTTAFCWSTCVCFICMNKFRIYFHEECFHSQRWANDSDIRLFVLSAPIQKMVNSDFCMICTWVLRWNKWVAWLQSKSCFSAINKSIQELLSISMHSAIVWMCRAKL